MITKLHRTGLFHQPKADETGSLFRYGRQCLLAFLLAVVVGPGLHAETVWKRGQYAAFTGESDILSPTDVVIRKSDPGEVVRIRMLHGDFAEVGSSLEDRPGGKVRLADLKPATAQDHEAWTTAGAQRKAEEIKEAAPLTSEPTPDEESALEAKESSAPTSKKPARPSLAASGAESPAWGWLPAGVKILSLARIDGGDIVLAGECPPPVALPRVRGWKGAAPSTSVENAPLPFLLHLSANGREVKDCVVFAPEEIGRIKLVHEAPGGALWILAERVGANLGGKDAPKAARCLVRMAKDLQTIERVIPLTVEVSDFAVDAANRPATVRFPSGRSGGSYLARFFSAGHFERSFPNAPDGPTRRLKLDFSSPALADGPFAIWAHKAETLPDTATPLGPWGSEPNAGQPIQWTNVKSGKNPIRGADLKPEALVVDREGNLYVSGTIPFHMGFPDFDPFLLKFSPDGKLLWTNTFLNGLLSEPDQKTQALDIDPTNGDVLVCYWQHGNNAKTLLLAPDGWLTKFTGTNGNIKIPWIGRVDAATGRLKNSTYIYSRIPNPPNKGWPDINSANVADLEVAGDGKVVVGGGTTISFPTTDNAFLPVVTEFGGHPMLVVLKPDLTAPHYSTYLSAGKGDVNHLALLANGAVLCVGTHSLEGTPPPVTGNALPDYLAASADAATGVRGFVAILPIPAEESEWNFKAE